VFILVGAVIVNQGIRAVGASDVLIWGIAMLVAGAVLVFVGVGRMWPGKLVVNFTFAVVGMVLLVASGIQISTVWRTAIYGLLMTIVGLALIVVGVQITKEGRKKYGQKNPTT
jgi:membrane-bound ClpP family serine protease